MPIGSGLPAGSAEIVAVIVAGGLGWAAQSYREFRNLEARIDAAILALQERIAREGGRYLAAIVRASLPSLVDAYFDQRPTEMPAPFTAEDLRWVSMQMDADAPRAPGVVRQSITEPATRRVAGELLQSLSDLSPSVALTPELLEATFAIGAQPSQLEEARAQGRYLSLRYLGQLMALVAWAATVLGTSFGAIDGLVPVAVGAAIAVHGISLEISRHRLERRLRPPTSIAEVAQA